MLESIVDNEPEFYLDKIEEELFDLGGGWWSASYILWTKLTGNIGYSLVRAAADRSYDADKKEQAEFLQAVQDQVVDPNQQHFQSSNPTKQTTGYPMS